MRTRSKKMGVLVLTVVSLGAGLIVLLIVREDPKFCFYRGSEDVAADLRMIRSQHPVQWTPDGARIVFDYVDYYPSCHGLSESSAPLKRRISDRDSSPPEGSIYVAAADGSTLLPITEGDGRQPIAHSPNISPDGSRIAYSTYEYRKERPSYFEIWTSALDGSDKRRLTKEKGLDFSPVWSPDGTNIAFLRHDEFFCSSFKRRGIYTMKADGSDVRRIAQVEDPQHKRKLVESLAWTPDGEALAFFVEEDVPVSDESYLRRTSLDLVKADGSERMRLLVGKDRFRLGSRWELSEFLSPLAWSPDGQDIAFLKLDDDDRAVLYTVSREGTDLRALADLGPADTTHLGGVFWSADGSQIAFLLGQSYDGVPSRYTMFVVDTDGSNLRVPGSGFHGAALALSPDGSRVAALVADEQDTVLYTVLPSGSDAQVLAMRNEGGLLEAAGSDQRPSVDFAPCSAGVSVPDPKANPDLVQDCEALVEMTDRIAVAELNWDADTPISEWEGVTLEAQVFSDEDSESEEPLPVRVRGLSLPGRGLIGGFPLEVTELTELWSLDLSGNELYGALPKELGKLVSLRVLKLDENDLRGPIPPELGNLGALKELDLFSNYLIGIIPPELGNLWNLMELNLGYNGLTGHIPPELGSLENLMTLNLWSNDLTGLIPQELSNLKNLRVLNLQFNDLSEPIPSELSNLKNLRVLNLSSNGLSGPIPPELGNLTELVTLNLRSNELSGPIPPELGDIENLRELNLEFNNLSGPFPPELGNLQSLERLNINNVDLVGCPPEVLYERGVYVYGDERHCDPRRR